MDFSFRDNNACGTPKSGQESLLKKDFVASPEVKSIDNKSGEKTDGKNEAFPGSGFSSEMPGEPTGSQFQGFLAEIHSGTTKKTLFSTDASGFSQTAMNMSCNMSVGMAPFQSSKTPSLTEPQKTSTLHVTEPPKPCQPPNKPSDTKPYNTLDNSAEVWGNPWTNEDMLSTELSHSPNKPEQSPAKPLGIQGSQDQDTTYKKESNEGGQQKNKKLDDMEDMHGLLESLRSTEKALSKSTDKKGSSPPSLGECWKSEIREWGGGRIQARKNKSRTKLPGEWATMTNISSPSPPPSQSPSMVTDMDIYTAITINNEQDSTLPSFTSDTTTTINSATPTPSQKKNMSPSTISDPSQSTPVITASLHTSTDFTSGFITTVGSIPSPQKKNASLNFSAMFVPVPSLQVSTNMVVSQNPAASASLTSLTKLQEPPLAKYPQLQVKDGLTAKDKTEKVDTSAEMVDNSGTSGNAVKSKKIEKIDTSMKKAEDLDKSQQAEKIDHKPTKNEKATKMYNEKKEEKMNGIEKVKAKEDKLNSAKPNLHSTGENLSSKKGPASKAKSPTTETKKSSDTTSVCKAKTRENGALPQRKPPVPKFNGSSKSNTRTAPTSSTVNLNALATPANNGTLTIRPSRITKPPVPKQVPLAKKPPVPRAPRNTRLTNAPLPDLKNVSSKIGSTDNMKYQPGGGKIQIVHKKLDFSHVTSRCGSKDNIKHVPGGGNVQILNKKIDVSKVTAKCGSKDNIKHNLGGNVKVESLKTEINTKANVGTPDSVSHKLGGTKMKTGGKEQNSEGGPSAPAANLPTQEDKGPKESGLGSSAVPSVGEELLNCRGLDKQIPATNKLTFSS